MRDGRSLRGFIAGVLVGVLVGSSGMAAAAFGYKLWATLPNPYKTGYMNGFLDMADLTRNLQPSGYVDLHFPQVPSAQPVNWRDMVDELYKDPKNQNYSILSILQLAAVKLQEKYGKGPSPDQRIQDKMRSQMDSLRKWQLAHGIQPTVPPVEEIPTAPKVIPFSAGPAETRKRKRCPCPDEAKATEHAAAAEGAQPEAQPRIGEAANPADATKPAEAMKAGDATGNPAAAKPTAPSAGKAAPAKTDAAPAAKKPAPATKPGQPD